MKTYEKALKEYDEKMTAYCEVLKPYNATDPAYDPYNSYNPAYQYSPMSPA